MRKPLRHFRRVRIRRGQPTSRGGSIGFGPSAVFSCWPLASSLARRCATSSSAYDDQAFVYENPHVTPGLTLSGLWWALTDGPFGEWCPLTTLSHMLDCQLYGLNPAGHYLTNVLLHAASSVLLFLVLLRMTGDLWPSAWVAAVFAIHPLHVESVAWVAERRDVLSGLFFMLTLGAYALYAERPSLARYLAVAGLLCAGPDVQADARHGSLPAAAARLLAARPVSPRGRRESTADRARGSVACRWLAAGGGKDPAHGPGGGELAGLSCRPTRRCSRPTRSTDCRWRHAWPMPWFRTQPTWASLFIPSIWLPFILIPAPTCRWPGLPDHWFCWWRSPRSPPTAGAGGLICWSAGCGFWECWCRSSDWWELVAHARADRYTYLSQIGLSIALAWGVWSVYRSRQSRQAVRWRRWMLAVVSAAAVLLLAAVAWRQTSYWRNAETLWTHALACTEQNALAHYNLGQYLRRAGKDRGSDRPAPRSCGELDSIDPQLTAKAHISWQIV